MLYLRDVVVFRGKDEAKVLTRSTRKRVLSYAVNSHARAVMIGENTSVLFFLCLQRAA